MFTLLVSWLLVAGVPGLLMLATLGLGRLERELARETVTGTDVDEFLEHAEAVDVHTLAREGMPEALEYLHRRQAQRLTGSPPPAAHAGPRHAAPVFAADFDGRNELGLPTRMRAHTRVNPQFGGTRDVNRV
ncbi:hypothetical protein H7H82_08590 [Mycobacterium heidelbergense]|uniref:Uncharacterized protein n=1 Tax=Mycobacterium heidelbergense TaxID=53376 RepID=A0A1X0DQ71_MYCHE|nr:hypothetical protein [Mycobacterium heidelbergense]MCV7050650.1 hypothetical protein [Mycobacterium heidelbergense]ORA74551.1 hypothetical protein BST25_09650 [Mycobacterium heidelbergense]BBZ50660.1 hypothetical protein MHEI_23770 [Mycobacterium heidelbergense]